MAQMTEAELDALKERVGNGIEWLAEHDPHGSFYAWWQAGLTPLSPLNAAATPEVKEAWVAWYGAMLTFRKLDQKLAYYEQRGFTSPWPIGWKPAQGVRA